MGEIFILIYLLFSTMVMCVHRETLCLKTSVSLYGVSVQQGNFFMGGKGPVLYNFSVSIRRYSITPFQLIRLNFGTIQFLTTQLGTIQICTIQLVRSVPSLQNWRPWAYCIVLVYNYCNHLM